MDEELEDLDWVMAMQEELNNFTRNEVWVLKERPQIRISLAPSGSSTTNKMSIVWWFGTRQDLWLRALHKLKGWILKHLPPLQDCWCSLSTHFIPCLSLIMA